MFLLTTKTDHHTEIRLYALCCIYTGQSSAQHSTAQHRCLAVLSASVYTAITKGRPKSAHNWRIGVPIGMIIWNKGNFYSNGDIYHIKLFPMFAVTLQLFPRIHCHSPALLWARCKGDDCSCRLRGSHTAPGWHVLMGIHLCKDVRASQGPCISSLPSKSPHCSGQLPLLSVQVLERCKQWRSPNASNKGPQMQVLIASTAHFKSLSFTLLKTQCYAVLCNVSTLSQSVSASTAQQHTHYTDKRNRPMLCLAVLAHILSE